MRWNLRFSVGKKLSILLLVLLTFGIAGATLLSAQLLSDDLAGSLRKGSLDSTSFLAGRLRSELKQIADRAQLLAGVTLEEFRFSKDRESFLKGHFSSDDRIVALTEYVFQETTGTDAPTQPTATVAWRVLNDDVAARLKLNAEALKRLDELAPLPLAELRKGETAFFPAASGSANLLRMSVPLVKNDKGVITHFLMIDIDRERFGLIFKGLLSNKSLLLDSKGRVLAGSETSDLETEKDFSKLTVVQDALQGKAEAGEIEFEDSHSKRQVASFQRLAFSGLSVMSYFPYERTLAAKQLLTRRMIFLALAFVFLALTAGLLYSRGITKRLGQLASAANELGSGNFKVRVPERDRKQLLLVDEIDLFKGTFNHMIEGLEQHEKMRSLIDKYHHREFAERLMRDEAKLGGEQYEAVVLFVDLRGYTELSEKVGPQGMVKLLNRYMGTMVEIILRNNGIVDKFIGDAIMAIWGVPEVDADMADNALKACLEMRAALVQLNREFQQEGLPRIIVGMGMSSGPVVAGNIGSSQRMEYTVVGDTVNVASRVQDMTKLFLTDLLVTDSVMHSIKKSYLACSHKDVPVRGRNEKILVHEIRGIVDEQTQKLAA